VCQSFDVFRRVISYLIWPAVITGSLLASYWGFHAGLSTGLWAFAVSAGNLILIVVLERLMPRRQGVDLFRDVQMPKDIGHGILVAGFGRPLAGPLSVAAIAALGALDPFTVNAPHWPVHWAMPAQVVLCLLIWSFASYWTHRAFHRIGRLWWFHAVHHDAREMHVLKGNRIHFAEDLIRQFWMLLPLHMLGVPTMVLVWMSLWNNFEGALAHSNVDQRFPSFAHWVLPTPQNHVVHHAMARELQDSNFGGVTPLWDILFGTYRHPVANPVTAVGIEASPVPEGFFAQLIFPLTPPRVAVLEGVSGP
jgi:sterol desaturase/sphingolipid hydroxylase (fatty acid hydroxylase superfamily)